MVYLRVLSRYLLEELSKTTKTSVRIASVPVEVRTGLIGLCKIVLCDVV
jgi:CRISPR/Cas system-associated protein Csm6